jgi:hypothetical protein
VDSIRHKKNTEDSRQGEQLTVDDVQISAVNSESRAKEGCTHRDREKLRAADKGNDFFVRIEKQIVMSCSQHSCNIPKSKK